MDFKDLLNNIKEIIAPEVLAFFAIFYFGIGKLFKIFKKLIGFNNEYENNKIKIDKILKENEQIKKKTDQIEKKIDEINKNNHHFKNQIIEKIIQLMKK